MKKLIILFLLLPLLSEAQDLPRFVHDTLYTSSGFKIYPGQTLRFGKGTGSQGFRYVTINNGIPSRSIENNSIIVRELANYARSIFGFMTIDVMGDIVFRDGSKGTLMANINFDPAIGSRLPGIPTEIILPEEFRITKEKAADLYMPFYEADTLYTSCGYPIYKGQTLQFGVPTGTRGRFKYVNIKNNISPDLLQNNQVKVTTLKNFAITAIGNGYIDIIGTLVSGNDIHEIEMHMAFDHAIGHSPASPGELLVPEEFKKRLR